MVAINKSQMNINEERLLVFLPFVISALIVIIFFILIFSPLNHKLNHLKSQIKKRESILVSIERGEADLDRLNCEIKELKVKINEYEKKLLGKEEVNILIGTLKDITAESYLKFSSIEPQRPKKFSLDKQKNIYLELPIKVKLKCGYYELIDFLAKIEKAGRLMKITDLKIKATVDNIWEHDVLLLISTFSKIIDNAPDSG